MMQNIMLLKILYQQYLKYNKYYQQMLRKNIVAPSPLISPPAVSTQTDQFLLYLPMQQKLSSLLEKYRSLQEEFEQVKNKMEYTQFKNKMLQNSLQELTFVFNKKLHEEKMICLDEIKELDQIIARQSHLLENGCDVCVSIFEEKKMVRQESKHTCCHKISSCSNRNNQEAENNKNCMYPKKRNNSLHQKKSSQISKKDKPKTQRQVQDMGDSHNQFLPTQFSKTHCLKQKVGSRVSPACLAFQLGEKSKIEMALKPQLPSARKKQTKINDKENMCIEKHTKREAELYLKTFMTNFQNTSRNDDKSLNSTNNLENSIPYDLNLKKAAKNQKNPQF